MVAAVKRGFLVGDLLRCEGKNHTFMVSWCIIVGRLMISCEADVGTAKN